MRAAFRFGLPIVLTAVLSPLASAQSAPAAAPAPSTQPTALPRVRLVATGGTISNKTGGRLTAEQLVALMPGVERWVRPEYEQFSNLASGQLTLQQWLDLSRRINQLLTEDDGPAGVVVTSGTDTMEEVAYFLDLTVRSDKPVVVVGSMRNPSTLGYEGAANLQDAFRVAGDPASRGRGVLVVLNDEINAAREVTKTDALRLDTFQSRRYGILGVVDSDRVVYYRDDLKRHTRQSEFDVSSVHELPRVDVIWVYQGAPGDLIKAAVDLGAKGIVVATAGAGATSGTEGEGLQYAMSKGVFVVFTTRTGNGRIAARRRAATGPNAARFAYWIAGEDLQPVKARILLMLALTKTHDAADIQRMFTEY
ncbi:MAG TPA: asparaginase [Vicinamibacterales bacterium]|nr:asparaginase [Vicinamibacterales bacterium]